MPYDAKIAQAETTFSAANYELALIDTRIFVQNTKIESEVAEPFIERDRSRAPPDAELRDRNLLSMEEPSHPHGFAKNSLFPKCVSDEVNPQTNARTLLLKRQHPRTTQPTPSTIPLVQSAAATSCRRFQSFHLPRVHGHGKRFVHGERWRLI